MVTSHPLLPLSTPTQHDRVLSVVRRFLHTPSCVSHDADGLKTAYSDVMRTMVIASTCIAVVPVIISLFMPNWYLGDQQNAVENVNLAGEPLDGMSADGVRKTVKEKEIKEKDAEAQVNPVA